MAGALRAAYGVKQVEEAVRKVGGWYDTVITPKRCAVGIFFTHRAPLDGLLRNKMGG